MCMVEHIVVIKLYDGVVSFFLNYYPVDVHQPLFKMLIKLSYAVDNK